jgi:hypothetical protein
MHPVSLHSNLHLVTLSYSRFHTVHRQPLSVIIEMNDTIHHGVQLKKGNEHNLFGTVLKEIWAKRNFWDNVCINNINQSIDDENKFVLAEDGRWR